MAVILFETFPAGDKRDNIKSKIKDIIADSKVTIRFIKANGEERILTGTNSPSLVPETSWDDPSGARKPNEAVQVIYDLENDGWRSFKWDNLIEISYPDKTDVKFS